ncbi:aspartic proteinase nepenthesin-1-like [Silene latifolia]|uniref:aspartic proteinase nepenthesin-1-like n=1 Tax=Silene latifolia TaxID=37657 RepID=UPI003D78603B
MTLTHLLHLLLHVISMLYQGNAFSMDIFPIDSHHLQILPTSFTSKERQHFLRNISLSRAFYANNRNSKLGLESIRSTLMNVQNSYFVTQLTFGSSDPPFSPLVILDTWADLTWIQCADCEACFNLKTSFKVENSSTYSRMDVEDTRCSPRINYEGSCGFEAYFGIGHTEGYLGMDTFRFSDSSEYFPNIAFGCGVKNHNLSFADGRDNMISGVHGLGIGPKSMMTQLDMDIKGRFTYCIRSDGKNSTINFGDDAQIDGGVGKTVETISMNPRARYHLYLAGITVEGHRLPINPSVFLLDDRDFTRGFFIDPSAPFTVLTNTAYIELRNAIINHFKAYNWEPLQKGSNDMFDLCYSDVPDGKDQVYPSVTFNFIKSPGTTTGEIKLLLHKSNVFGNIAVKNGFCLQMLPTPGSKDGPSIFGAFQQTNFQFLFDVKTRLLSFVPKDC